MAQEEDNYHPAHNDSTADLVIECPDGVKFRVHSYLLMAHRYVEEEMQ